MRATIAFLVVTCALAGLDVPAAAQTPPREELRARRAIEPPRLDGVLDDELWSGEPLPLDPWVSYNPLRGEPEQQRTRVWIGYDAEAIYFAFRCLDLEPDRIRSTISRRDTAWNDDWVGVSLDSSRAGQIAYHMFVNPSGIQMDALQSTEEDSAADWVWQSAGRIDEEGYVVEIRVPLQSLRFRDGSDVRMGMLFFRRNSRLGISWSWPEMAPGEWVFEAHVPVAFGELQQPLLLELIPSATLSRNQARAAEGGWQGASSKGDLGLSVKYGITSTMTLDATINPDFSQVESDAFEVEVNTRFPVFFDEKRPFFMEGLGLFNLAGTGGDASMRTAVHTRQIVEPSAGVKLTGTAGRYTFGTLVTPDASLDPDAHKVFTIGRGVRNFGEGQYVGVLVTDTELRRDHNRVIAADLSLKHGDRFRWNGNVLLSDSAAGGEASRGLGGQLSYSYDTRRISVSGQVEHYDRGFRMDTAFINRVGLTRGWQYQQVSFYPDEKRHAWLKRVAPFLWVTSAEDRVQGGTELWVLPGIRFDFTRQGYLRLDMMRGHETFAGRRFTVGRLFADGGAQITRWLNVAGSINAGPAVYYDEVDPFQGTRRAIDARIGFQPNARLNQNLTYTFERFERRATGEKVFDVHILNLRNTYQFTPRFLLRAITQYDSARRRVLGDFLASYELVPGTVVHGGYGSLWERADRDPYQATARALFFKASYLARF